MRIITLFSLLCIVWSCAQEPSANQTADQNQPADTVKVSVTKDTLLFPIEFQQKLQATAGAQLVDVRTAAEIQSAGALPGHINIDFNRPDFQDELAAKLDPEKPVFVYCAAGTRSEKSIANFSNLGFKVVYHMNGGYNKWLNDIEKVPQPKVSLEVKTR